VLAGGQQLLVEPSRSRLASTLLVDLQSITELAGIERQPDGSLKIGAMTTLAAIAGSSDIRAMWPVLADAARMSGDAQTRNRATIGGSLASPDPQADLPAVALALDASIEVVGSTGSRTIGSGDLVTGGGQAGLRSDEIITRVIVPGRRDRSGAAYEKFIHPATLGALCGIAACVVLGANESIADARVALTGATDRAVRLGAAERALSGQQPSDAVISAAASTTPDAGVYLDDHFASAEYRRHLARVLTARAVQRAVEQARGSKS
jgi:carbon-monoxide dehydrogenase medium subunit